MRESNDMKLWKISQHINNGYDTYDAAVVAAETEAEAKLIDPGDGENIRETSRWWTGNASNVFCEYLGDAKEGTKKGVICASFNAG